MFINVHYRDEKVNLELKNVRTRNLILNPSSLNILDILYYAISVLKSRQSKRGMDVHLLFELSPRDVAHVIGKKIPGRLEVDAHSGKLSFKVLTRKGVVEFSDIQNLEAVLAGIEIIRSKTSLKIYYRRRVQEFMEIKSINDILPSVNTYVFADNTTMSVGTIDELSPVIKRTYLASRLFKRVVLVEGASDEAILRTFARKIGLEDEGVVFVWLEGRDNVEEIIKHRSLLGNNVMCILDGDYKGSLKSPIYVHLWSKGEIENYLLSPEAVLSLLLDKGVCTTLNEVIERLLKFQNLKKGSHILKAVFKEYGLSYRKARDGVKLAECLKPEHIDGEVRYVLKFAYAQDL